MRDGTGDGGSTALQRGVRFALRVVAWMLVLLLVLAVLWLWLGSRSASRNEAELGLRLEAALGEGSSLANLSRPRAADQSAHRVVELAAAVGIRLDPEVEAGEAEMASILTAVDRYVDRELESEDEGIAAPPPAVAEYLDARRGGWDALRVHLLTADPPRWAESARLFDRVRLDLTGYLQLHSVLVADALAAAAEGDEGRTESDLEASWRLNLETANSVDLGVLRVVAAVARLQAEVLRRVAVKPDPWLQRLRAEQLGDGVRRALLVHTWLWVERVRSGGVWEEVEQGGTGPIAEPLARPWLRLSIVERGALMLRAIAELESRDPLEVDADTFDGLWLRQMSRWNLLGQVAWTSPVPLCQEAALARLDLELTRRILELRQLEHDGDQWPPTIPARDCEAVPGRSWHHRVDGAGTVEIRLEPPVRELRGAAEAMVRSRAR